jgi:hypothetical protein
MTKWHNGEHGERLSNFRRLGKAPGVKRSVVEWQFDLVVKSSQNVKETEGDTFFPGDNNGSFMQ